MARLFQNEQVLFCIKLQTQHSSVHAQNNFKFMFYKINYLLCNILTSMLIVTSKVLLCTVHNHYASTPPPTPQKRKKKSAKEIKNYNGAMLGLGQELTLETLTDWEKPSTEAVNFLQSGVFTCMSKSIDYRPCAPINL